MRMTALSIVTVCAVAAAASAWEVPAIPAGRRAQFYLLKEDGGYQYGYDTGTGHSASAAADAGNEVQGAFRYRAADGRDVAVSYSAGQGGYVPQLSAEEARAGHISPPAGVGPRISGVRATSSNSAVEQDPDYDANADASYSFTIDTDSYKRKEESDARGNVRGSYSYSSPQGGSHSLSYTAGEGTGFVLTGGSSSSSSTGATVGAGHVGTTGTATTSKQLSNVPSVIPYSSEGTSSGHSVASTPYSGPVANIRSDHNADGSYSFAFGTDVQSREESADAQNNVRGSYSFTSDGARRRVDYEAGAATGFVARGDHLPVAPVSLTSAPPPAPFPVPVSVPALPAVTYSAPAVEIPAAANVDGSYSFAFNTADQSRQESSDARNNVRGSYSFKAKDDGKVRRIDYEAGSATGFVARGDHLPVAPAGAAAPVDAVAISSYSAPSTSYLPPSHSSYATDAQSSSNADGSYSFAYETNDQSRQEAADAQNNVRGSYSFTAPGDSQRRRVDYEAGAATGFVAKGAHLPVAPALPSVSRHSSYSAPAPPVTSAVSTDTRSASNPDGSYAFSYSTDELSREESADAQNNVRGSYSFRTKGSGATRRVDYEAGAATGFVARGDHLPRVPVSAPIAPSAAIRANPSAAVREGSYTFSYDAGDHSRQEAIDSSGNVRGSYSFVAKDDGRSRRVDYSAGAATGFLATGDHLPKTPVPASVPATRSHIDDGSSSSGDASYAYSYETDSSKKSESADAQGNVRGEYSYVAGDGSTRRVTYTVRGEEGFVASGDLSPSAAGAAAVQTAKSVARTNQRVPTSHSRSSQANAASKFRAGGLRVDQYLPPQSSHKFGYVFDTKA